MRACTGRPRRSRAVGSSRGAGASARRTGPRGGGPGRVVVGVVSTQVTGRGGGVGGAPLRRLAPRPPVGRLRARLRPRPAGVTGQGGAAAAEPPPRAPAWRRAGLRAHRAL